MANAIFHVTVDSLIRMARDPRFSNMVSLRGLRSVKPSTGCCGRKTGPSYGPVCLKIVQGDLFKSEILNFKKCYNIDQIIISIHPLHQRW